MGIEIERKFLLRDDAWRADSVRSRAMAQGYLVGAAALAAGQARAAVRVRVAGEEAWLTVKAAQAGVARAEYEVPLPLTDAREMLAHLCAGVIEKVRHYVPVAGFTFEIDEFAGANAGLVVAEVELPAAEAAYPRPAWLGREVTQEVRYYNVNLLQHPFCEWTVEEHAGC